MNAEQEAPDFFDPALECGAWIKKPGVIGALQHTHVCRELAGHRLNNTDHICGCEHHW